MSQDSSAGTSPRTVSPAADGTGFVCPTPRNGHRCKRRTCPSCGRLWAGDTRQKLFINFIAYAGDAGLITATAPGADVLPWDTTQCRHDPGERCSGPKGCRVRFAEARAWNESAPANWRALHNAASQYTRRRFPRQLKILGMAWEYHQRGVLHRHVVVGLATPMQRHAARVYGQRLKDLSRSWGFGNIDTKISARPSRESAAYLSSYFISGNGGKASIRETVMRKDVPPLVVYVSRELTKLTGCTMRSLRRDRYLFALSRRYRVSTEGAQAVADYIKNTGVVPVVVITTQAGWLIVRGTTGEIDELSATSAPVPSMP